MKICFFTEIYYKGGVDTFLINLFNAWPNEKDNLTLYCNGSHPGITSIEKKTTRALTIQQYNNVYISAISKVKGKSKWSRSIIISGFLKFSYKILQYPVIFPWYVFKLMLFFRHSKFDRLMVVNGGYPASLLCRSAVIAWWLSGKQHLALMNFHSISSTPWYYRFFENSIDKLVVRSASHIVSVSKNCIESLNRRSAFKNCNKLSYIYNGIEDPTHLLKNNLTSIENSAFLNQYCLMLGSYDPRKGHSYLLKAFQNVVKDFPNVKLKIFGYGSHYEKKMVHKIVKQLHLDDYVILSNFTADTLSLIKGASVMVVPSQEYESFGLTIIEAMAFGVPVVATNVGGMPEVLEGSNAGYVCSKDDPLEFADAIKSILSNPLLASELGKNSRLAFESRFMATKMTNSYRKLIE